jgi:2-iminobutanoate/2-iminopropanoate deaminase
LLNEQHRFIFEILIQFKMKKKIIQSDQAPAPIGPYSQAVIAGNMIYVSGQIALHPVTGELVMSNLEAETRQVMENIRAILAQASVSFDAIVKSSIFLSDMAHFTRVNEVYASFFTGNYPARETIQVAGLPKNVNVEISVIAFLSNPS